MLDIRCCDNKKLMAEYPDGYFDLGIVDPPYGIKEDGRNNHTRSNKAKASDYRAYSKYDINKPDEEYFKELYRITKNQIIWGANHYGYMPASPCWIIWDKKNGATDFADCELAYTSFKGAARKFEWRWAGMLQEDMKNKQVRIHPNEKPIQLYKFLLDKFAKPGDKIFDSHLGSGSIAIACHDYGFDLVACELDKDYYEAAMKRINAHVAQTKLF